MASCNNSIQILFTLLLFTAAATSLAQKSIGPRALVIPVSKDPSTLQYVVSIKQRTPLVPVQLVADLGGPFLWVACDGDYVSSTYRPVHCHKSQCPLTQTNHCNDCFSSGPRPGCNNNTCESTPGNSVMNTGTFGEFARDAVSVQSTDGVNPGREVSVSRFTFSCATKFLLPGLAKGASGMAAFGRTELSLPSQFASAFSFRRNFAVCLPSGSSQAKGVIIFGDGPYSFLPDIEVSQFLTYSPLFVNPVSTAFAFSSGGPSADYFIGVTSIAIDGKPVPVNTSLLSITKEGNGGTKISTVNPYTVLEDSIYKALTKSFVKACAARNIRTVASVAPFDVCFSSKNVFSTRLGPSVPTIELVLQNKNVIWRIFGVNSMVQVKKDVLCLGFVNGGESPRTSIVIGGHQIEDNLLQFDLGRSRFGFSSLLYGVQTSCANFNFTSTA